ncbi:TPA: LOW QUALITY PROTEIN: hypothetical protein N0F65_004519 [Lagenidium giganteum]|uniref:B box-type domain-containing protein n=1 Tax=Lagenidium giganteum TaxID=4803 RepID=A0AAV2YXL6_9STRA|nr:TPA: LOW QUALITY PROTEIN: hypothetical protein N0F65_004519 [Lagenidium giganteum]
MLTSDDSQRRERELENNDDPGGAPLWFRSSFAAAADGTAWWSRDFVATTRSQLQPDQSECATPRSCEECSARSAWFRCSDCALLLCFECTDAIHILEDLASHHVEWFHTRLPPSNSNATDADVDPDDDFPAVGFVPVLALDQTPALAPAPAPTGAVCSTPREQLGDLRPFHPTKEPEHRLFLPPGTKVLFRSPECARWSRELLHGLIVSTDGVRAHDGGAFYYRVLWVRGIDLLPNGFFRANLCLEGFPLTPAWPIEIGVFTSLMAALRAVVTAEKLGRKLFRREQVSGRLDVATFPSVNILNEVLEATDTTLTAEFRVRLTKSDDQRFLEHVSRGDWDVTRWLQALGRPGDVAEEMVACKEPLMPWKPSSRLRFFLLEQHELLFPKHVAHDHVAAIVEQMLFVYMGFAWRRWLQHVRKSRHHERQQRRAAAAMRLQGWWRVLMRRWLTRELQSHQNNVLMSSAAALDLYRRRQLYAAKLYRWMEKQYQDKQRNALRWWAHRAGIDTPDVQRRLVVPHQVEWHPSHDIRLLPKLPKMYAHRQRDGSLAVEDVAKYKQFRANHAGPTDSAYWIIRQRVLAGTYPVGPACSEARRIVARADSTTSILLQDINVFVCLVATDELRDHEQRVWEQQQQQSKVPASAAESSAATTAAWYYESVVRTKYDALRHEYTTALRISDRQAELAQQELDEAPEDEDLAYQDNLESRIQLAKQNAATARKALDGMRPLQFAHVPIVKDGIPERAALNALLVSIEDWLRARHNVYVFSLDGHGRTGLVAAMLLGRLYGLPAIEALERAQRVHDCQWAMHNVPSTRAIASPKTATQITMVQQALAPLDAIYVPVVSENPAEHFHKWRAQQRGMPIESFQTKDGYMITAAPTDDEQQQQLAEYDRLQRIAKRETASIRLQSERRRERLERDAMALSDCPVEVETKSGEE